jgi:hypothetical protein
MNKEENVYINHMPNKELVIRHLQALKEKQLIKRKKETIDSIINNVDLLYPQKQK